MCDPIVCAQGMVLCNGVSRMRLKWQMWSITGVLLALQVVAPAKAQAGLSVFGILLQVCTI